VSAVLVIVPALFFIHHSDVVEVDTGRSSKEGDDFDEKGSKEESCWIDREGHVEDKYRNLSWARKYISMGGIQLELELELRK